jgi:hypothetical protein
LKDLEKLTKDWNAKIGKEIDDGFLCFDVYLDRDNYDLLMELDEETEQFFPEIQFLKVCNLSNQTTLA